MRPCLLTICLMLCALVAPLRAAAADAAAGRSWNQFRGPTAQGHASPAANPPTHWSENTNVAWKVPVPGRGWSSPVIDCGRIWLSTASEDGNSLRAASFDLATGQMLYDVEVLRPQTPPPINPKNSYASPTPIVEGGRLYVHYGTMGTACLDAATGRVLWTNDSLKLDHKEGPGSSPVSWGDLLLINCDGMDVQYVVALHKATGAIAWKTDRSGANDPNPDFRKAYSTPLVIQAGGRDQLVSAGASRVSAYDPATGDELWWVDYTGFSNVPAPLFADGLLFVCTGYLQPQLWAIRPLGQGDLTATAVVWKYDGQVPANPSPIWFDGRIYITSDQGVASCLDAPSGSLLWQKRLGGNYSASPIEAGGRLYFFSEDGVGTVLKPGPKASVLAKNRLDGRILASPAVAGDALLVRTEGHLYRLAAPDSDPAASK